MLRGSPRHAEGSSILAMYRQNLEAALRLPWRRGRVCNLRAFHCLSPSPERLKSSQEQQGWHCPPGTAPLALSPCSWWPQYPAHLPRVPSQVLLPLPVPLWAPPGRLWGPESKSGAALAQPRWVQTGTVRGTEPPSAVPSSLPAGDGQEGGTTAEIGLVWGFFLNSGAGGCLRNRRGNRWPWQQLKPPNL